ncbi:MAG: hypothetical protein A3H97_12825 [Acidobacteria bacterium RIFCSPLOWO2_02_FULL_65_29]|nr:MAG: hypothetical protein A3H97_12825 [Acidobacteria bacterium RIFCSPLOWO2_02_FULL_65_29]
MADRPRVIVALPNLSECAAVADWLSAEGFEPLARSSSRAAFDEMHALPFDLLIADAAFAFRDGLHTRGRGRARNPLTPTIVIGGTTRASRGEAVTPQIMYLTRPIEHAMLVCFVSMAFMDSRPTRRSARKPASQFDAFVNGLPARLLDVSNEGFRLEVPPDQRSPLPPYFNIRIPVVGVSVTAQRVWTRTSPSRASARWYGGALAQNRIPAERAWRSFVDTIPVVGGAVECVNS